MKNLLLFISIAAIMFSCNQTNEKSIELNDNIKNAWTFDHLKGKVKKITKYRANISGSNNHKTESKKINHKKTYTKNGKVLLDEYYNVFGELEQETINEYDDNEQRIKTITQKPSLPYKIIENLLYDKKGNVVSLNFVYNDSLTIKASYKYDINNNPIEQILIENNDTTFVKVENKLNHEKKPLKQIAKSKSKKGEYISIIEHVYDDKGNILERKETTNSEHGKEENMSGFKYDNKGNIIESISEIFNIKYKKVTEYKDNKVIRVTKYTIPLDLREHLDEIIEYDRYFNPVNQKIYEDSELERELKNEYEFDHNGNWIKKKSYMKEHFNNSKKFVPIYVENREIEYWR